MQATVTALEMCVFFIEPTMFVPSLPPIYSADKEERTSVPQTVSWSQKPWGMVHSEHSPFRFWSLCKL